MWQVTGFIPDEGDAAGVSSDVGVGRYVLQIDGHTAIHTNDPAVAREYFTAVAEAAGKLVEAADIALIADAVGASL